MILSTCFFDRSYFLLYFIIFSFFQPSYINHHINLICSFFNCISGLKYFRSSCHMSQRKSNDCSNKDIWFNLFQICFCLLNKTCGDTNSYEIILVSFITYFLYFFPGSSCFQYCVINVFINIWFSLRIILDNILNFFFFFYFFIWFINSFWFSCFVKLLLFLRRWYFRFLFLFFLCFVRLISGDISSLHFI